LGREAGKGGERLLVASIRADFLSLLLPPSLLLHRQLASRTPGVEPNFSLPISRFLTALRFSMKDDWLELDDAEAICFSLIQQVRLLSLLHLDEFLAY